MNNTNYFIENYKTSYVKSFFNENAMYENCVLCKSDIKKIERLLTIKTLTNFWDNVRKFTKNVSSDFSIGRWQSLAELREIQLDLQENYKYLLAER